MLGRGLSTWGNAAMVRAPPKNPLILVLGATGTGKSQLAVDLATRFNGEIINGDAMQMYEGLPIITNKITAKEQQGIPHHLLGCIRLDEDPWVVGIFRKRASKIIQEIRTRGCLPIVVGGTHYYTQSLLFEDTLVEDKADVEEEGPDWLSDQEISASFPILGGSTEAMLEKLKEVDPIMASRWHPNDRRKIRRSLEIFLFSGRKASDIYAEQKEARYLLESKSDPASDEPSCQPLTDTLLFWVHSDTEVLKERLDDRVDKMLEAGLIDEVKSMNDFLNKQEASANRVDRTRGIWVSIGWKEFEQYLAALGSNMKSGGKLEELYDLSIEQTKVATRQYAKRQTRWIRLKLMPALSSKNALERLYLLDGSNTSLWVDRVSNPALAVTKDFLAGDELPPPSNMSDAARHFLKPQKTIDQEDVNVRQECEMCNTVCVREEQWQAHLKSRRHRALVKKRQRNPNGMSSLPNNESKSETSDFP